MCQEERLPDQQARQNFGDDEGALFTFPETMTFGNGCGKPWRIAACIEILRSQVNALAPDRRKASDGTIGDTAHCSRDSDHNPHVEDGEKGVVTAFDITHDVEGGCDCETLAEELRASQDRRIKYIIWNRRICSPIAMDGQVAWAWRSYTRSNPHTGHLHISVMPAKALYDDGAPWSVTLQGR